MRGLLLSRAPVAALVEHLASSAASASSRALASAAAATPEQHPPPPSAAAADDPQPAQQPQAPGARAWRAQGLRIADRNGGGGGIHLAAALHPGLRQQLVDAYRASLYDRVQAMLLATPAAQPLDPLVPEHLAQLPLAQLEELAQQCKLWVPDDGPLDAATSGADLEASSTTPQGGTTSSRADDVEAGRKLRLARALHVLLLKQRRLQGEQEEAGTRQRGALSGSGEAGWARSTQELTDALWDDALAARVPGAGAAPAGQPEPRRERASWPPSSSSGAAPAPAAAAPAASQPPAAELQPQPLQPARAASWAAPPAAAQAPLDPAHPYAPVPDVALAR